MGVGFFGNKPTCSGDWLGLKPYEIQSFEPLLWPALALFVAVTIGRFVFMRMLIGPLASAACGDGAADAKARRKFREASWRACLYMIACVWAGNCMLFRDLDWMSDSRFFWVGWPNQVVTPEMLSVYAVYVAFYVHQLIFLFFDTKSSDFIALLIHHLITLSIVVASWAIGFTRVGSFTMVLHDVSDVFLEVAKCFNYSQKKHPKLSTGADVAFVIFATTFFYLRLYIYPTRVVHSALFQGCEHVTCVEAPWPIEACWRTGVAIFFYPLLIGLQLLQVFWGYKVIGVVTTVIMGKPLEDPRDE